MIKNYEKMKNLLVIYSKKLVRLVYRFSRNSRNIYIKIRQVLDKRSIMMSYAYFYAKTEKLRLKIVIVGIDVFIIFCLYCLRLLVKIYNYLKIITLSLFVNFPKLILNFTGILIPIYLFIWLTFNNFYNFNIEESSLLFWFTCFFRIDNISWVFILLTGILIFTSILTIFDLNAGIKYRSYSFLVLILILYILLICVFSISDLLSFYIFFESTLIPMFFIIGIWGSRQRKIHAVYVFFFYTFIGSILFIIGILLLFNEFPFLDYLVLQTFNTTLEKEKILWLLFFIALCVKVPMFPFHIWLPEAHVEAPTVGSVILAGILLKLGTYGMFRFLLPLFPVGTLYYYPFVLLLCVLAIVYVSFTTIRQVDLKKIIAYASISHMAYVVLGLISTNVISVIGSVYLMISHGLVSSALFYAVGCLYHRYHTRIINYYHSLLYFMPIFGIILLILILSNISFPGTSNFIGEFLILTGIIYDNFIICIIAVCCILPASIYSIWIYNRLMGGAPKKKSFLIFFCDISFNEFIILILLCILIILGGLFPMYILERLEYACLYFNDLRLTIFEFDEIMRVLRTLWRSDADTTTIIIEEITKNDLEDNELFSIFGQTRKELEEAVDYVRKMNDEEFKALLKQLREFLVEQDDDGGVNREKSGPVIFYYPLIIIPEEISLYYANTMYLLQYLTSADILRIWDESTLLGHTMKIPKEIQGYRLWAEVLGKKCTFVIVSVKDNIVYICHTDFVIKISQSQSVTLNEIKKYTDLTARIRYDFENGQWSCYKILRSAGSYILEYVAKKAPNAVIPPMDDYRYVKYDIFPRSIEARDFLYTMYHDWLLRVYLLNVHNIDFCSILQDKCWTCLLTEECIMPVDEETEFEELLGDFMDIYKIVRGSVSKEPLIYPDFLAKFEKIFGKK